MTALTNPNPASIDLAAFGRRYDDRAPLLFAASAAVLIHALAMLIPLPDADQPQFPPPRREPPGIVIVSPQPPERPPQTVEPPPLKERRKIPVPLPDPDEPELVDEPDFFEEPIEIADIEDELSLGEIEPPEFPALVDEDRADLTLPVAIHQPKPEFPEMARIVGRSGRVILRAVVDDAGQVTDIEVVFAPTPDLGFSAEAIKALSRWRYTPGELYGRTVSVRMTVSVEFTLH